MREILFRGKRADNGEWIEGHYATLLNPLTVDGIPKRHCIYTGTNFGDIVNPETVGQYTGLTDKNDKKIFEGDIVKLTVKNSPAIEWTAVVKFGNPNCTYSWGWQLDRISGDDPNPDILLWVDMEDAGVLCKVIGNIHDNLELLKEA